MSDSVEGITAKSLSFEYPGRVVWQELSFTLTPGSLAAVRGESGSGKTTLLQCLGSLEQPTTGSLCVFGQDVGALRGAALRAFRRNCVGFVFQNAGLVASWSVRKNVEVGGYRIKDDPERAREVFEGFGLPFDLLDVPVHRLSGGEQQRVGIIRLALRRPPLMLLDEPTAALDDENSQRVTNFLRGHCRSGGIALVATHDARVVEHVTDDISLSPVHFGKAENLQRDTGDGQSCDGPTESGSHQESLMPRRNYI